MENKKNDDNMPFAIGMGAIVTCAVISQKAELIKWWFYDHLMTLAALAFLFIVLVVTWKIHKMKKKEEEHFARMRAVNSVKPRRDRLDYYQRRENNE